MLGKLFSKRPDAALVARRSVVLACCAREALAWPPPDAMHELFSRWSDEDRQSLLRTRERTVKDVVGQMERSGAWSEATAGERRLIAGQLTRRSVQEYIDAAWAIESLACCLWALRVLEDLQPYDAPYGPDVLERLSSLPAPAAVRLRPVEEIDRRRSVAELWNWRARTRRLSDENTQLPPLPDGLTLHEIISRAARAAAEAGDIPHPIGDDFPAFGLAYRDLATESFLIAQSVAMERHKAFNWICGYAPHHRWDRTPTDT